MKLILATLLLLCGCTTIKPEHIRINGQTYIQGPATKAPPLPGLPDLGEHQLVPLTAESEVQMTQRIPVWGCTGADYGTTLVGIALGVAKEANPLGILLVPLGIIVNHSDDPKVLKTTATTHCVAGAANLLVLF